MRDHPTISLAQWPSDVPAQAYHEHIVVRSYEVDRSGSVSPATILRYLEYLATRASADQGFDHHWYEQRGVAWFVREMHLLLGARPGINSELVLATWLSEFRRVQAHREYAIWDASSRRLVARARARWAYVDRERGLPVRIHDELLANFVVPGAPMRARPLPALRADMPTSRYEIAVTARQYEVDTQQHVNNAMYLDWLSEAVHHIPRSTPALARRGRPRYIRVEYVRPTMPGDDVLIETRVAPSRSRGVRIWQEISNRLDGELRVRAYSEYVLCRELHGAGA